MEVPNSRSVLGVMEIEKAPEFDQAGMGAKRAPDQVLGHYYR